MRGFIALCILAFCTALGLVVGNRMSSEAMAVVVGVVCGVLAGIPTAVLLLILLRTQQRSAANGRTMQPVRNPDFGSSQLQHSWSTSQLRHSWSASYPPIIVVGGTPSQPSLPVHPDPNTVDGMGWALEAPRREFRVIGEE